MDPISAISMMTGAQASSPLGGIGAGGITPSISPQELQQLNSDVAAQPAGGAQSAQTGGSFQNLLGDFVGDVNSKQTAADDAVAGLMSGKNVSLHQAMISMEEASVSFSMMVEVRNKLLDSYQELMRMQI
jgi:flagellar hook-basal body complex protein FliE